MCVVQRRQLRALRVAHISNLRFSQQELRTFFCVCSGACSSIVEVDDCGTQYALTVRFAAPLLRSLYGCMQARGFTTIIDDPGWCSCV
jgi:hypothetical protein